MAARPRSSVTNCEKGSLANQDLNTWLPSIINSLQGPMSQHNSQYFYQVGSADVKGTLKGSTQIRLATPIHQKTIGAQGLGLRSTNISAQFPNASESLDNRYYFNLPRGETQPKPFQEHRQRIVNGDPPEYRPRSKAPSVKGRWDSNPGSCA